MQHMAAWQSVLLLRVDGLQANRALWSLRCRLLLFLLLFKQRPCGFKPHPSTRGTWRSNGVVAARGQRATFPLSSFLNRERATLPAFCWVPDRLRYKGALGRVA